MQTGKKGLSKRERLLLVIVLTVGLLAAVVMYVYIPLYNQLVDKTAELGNLRLEKTRIESSLASEGSIKDNRDQSLQQYNKDSSRFINHSLSNEIGRMLTGLCESHGLQPVSQQLSTPKDFTTEERRPGDNAAANGDTVFLIISAVMTVRGEYDELKSLLDTVEQTEYLRISRVSFNKDTGNTEAMLSRITVYFEVTMLKDVTFEA